MERNNIALRCPHHACARRPTHIRFCNCVNRLTPQRQKLTEYLRMLDQEYESQEAKLVTLPFLGDSSERPILYKMQDPLHSLTNHVRLLKLAPGKPRADLSGELVTFKFAHHPRYCAISYNLEEISDKDNLSYPTGDIKLDSTVADSLRAVRRLNDHIYVWVDILCLDQEIRNHFPSLIAQMESIYQSAQYVFWWAQRCADELYNPHMSDPVYLHRGDVEATISPGSRKSGFRMPLVDNCFDKSAMLNENSFQPTEVPKMFIMHELETCRASFGRVLRSCGVADYKLFGIVVSAVTMSPGRLNLREIARIATLCLKHSGATQTLDETIEFFTLQGWYSQTLMKELDDRLSRDWSAIFSRDGSNRLSFKHNHMLYLVRSIKLPGIDPTDSFMTDVCLKELSLVTAALKSSKNFDCGQVHIFSDFHMYSSKYWFLHYQRAQHQDSALSGRVHSFLWSEVTMIKPGNADDHESTVGPCSLYCLECLNWMIEYCSQHEFTCLRELYVHLNETSKRRPENVARNRACYSQTETSLSDHLSRLSILENRCTIPRSTFVGLRRCPWRDTDGSQHMEQENDSEEWILVE